MWCATDKNDRIRRHDHIHTACEWPAENDYLQSSKMSSDHFEYLYW